MSENILEHVQSIETEADRIVAEAQRSARKLQQSLDDETAKLRARHEEQLREKVASVEQELDRETEQRLETLDEEARAARQQLESLDREGVSGAVQFIVAKLREDA